jgi:hypothetical protein
VDRDAEVESYQVQIELSSLDGTTIQTCVARTIKNLARGTGVVDWRERKKDFAHLKQIPFPKLPQSAQISVLIGVDYPFLLHAYKALPNLENEKDPIGLLTPLGWSCVGRSDKKDKEKEAPKMVAFCSDFLVNTISWFQAVFFCCRNGTESGSKD